MREIFGEEFASAENFLNSATFGLPSRSQTEQLRRALRDWEAGDLAPLDFDASVIAARAAFAALTGTEVGRVSMGGSVSALLGLVAASCPDGSTVAVIERDFTSVTGPFAAQAGRGVRVTPLRPDEFEARAGEYDIAAGSLVQSADGGVLDLDALRRSVAGSSTRVVIDVTQALGWKKVDLGWADVVAGGSYKWLLSPRGAAWMAVSPRVERSLIPHAANWYASETPWSNVYEFPLLLAPDARRFDASPAWFTLLGAANAMPWLASLDMAAVEQHCVGLTNTVRSALKLPESNSAILSIEQPDAARRLEDAGIRAVVRAGRARVSFHLYNTEADAEALIDALVRGRGTRPAEEG